jgi:hypothetical protein
LAHLVSPDPKLILRGTGKTGKKPFELMGLNNIARPVRGQPATVAGNRFKRLLTQSFRPFLAI